MILIASAEAVQQTADILSSVADDATFKFISLVAQHYAMSLSKNPTLVPFYSQSSDDVLEFYNVKANMGLDHDQVLDARKKYGLNEIKESDSRSLFLRFLDQFNDNLAFILLGSAIISFLISLFDQDLTQLSWSSLWSFVEPVVILLILIANAIVGLIQESSADAAIRALKTYAPQKCNVLRNGEVCNVSAQELVPGDLVKLAIGDRVPADCRILSIPTACGLRVDQSVLTGESNSVAKISSPIRPSSLTTKVLIQDQTNMIFSGTLVTLGHCVSIVVATGNNTEMGKIAQSIGDLPNNCSSNRHNDNDDNGSPLKKRLDSFGNDLAKGISVLCILIWLINIPHFKDEAFGLSWVRGALYYFKLSVALAVAAIPEGLSMIITMCLALGTRRMAQQKAIVRSLSSVETIGCTTLICSDKTGTLTTNSMSAKIIITNESLTTINETPVIGTTYDPNDGSIEIDKHKQKLFDNLGLALELCTEATVHVKEGNKVIVMGEPTEISLVTLSKKISQALPQAEANKRKFISTLDFDRTRKSSSRFWEINDKYVLFAKGAPESILSRCTHIMLENGTIEKLSKNIHDSILERAFFLASANAYRILAVAKKNFKEIPQDIDNPDAFSQIESNLTLLGLVGIEDPPRQEVAEAIGKCITAGIRVVMITGDSKATADAIAKKIGLVPSKSDTLKNEVISSITGNEIDAMSDDQLAKVCRDATVFSRTDPSHKLRLVNVFRHLGHIVAMTGDGVNDAPALKRAHIGIAMGGGSDVAKEASDLVLTDGNFSAITRAIAEGRAIFDNTQQFIRYLISSNIGEVASLLLGTMFGASELLAPVQLLWVNLVTDGLPATALSFNPSDPYCMHRPPRSATAPFVDSWRFIRYLTIGTYVGIATLWSYFSVDASIHPFLPSTMALSVLVVIEMFNALNSISETESLLSVYPWTNGWLLGAIFLSLLLHILILHVPFLAAIFKVHPLTLCQWSKVVLISFPVIMLDEGLKYITRLLARKPRKTIKEEHVPLLSK